jgi:hypothetical protein
LRHQVRFVVIGGYAALLHGLARATQDLDVVPDPERENLARLADALSELGARLRVPDAEPPERKWSVEGFDQFTTITTRTTAGDLDICPRPDAPGGRTFRDVDLQSKAVIISVPPAVPVAALEDVIAALWRGAGSMPSVQRDLRVPAPPGRRCSSNHRYSRERRSATALGRSLGA